MIRALRFCLCLIALLPSYARAQVCDDPRPLRLALIPKKNAEALLADYQPLIRQLEKTLDRPVEVVPSPSYGTVIEGILAGSVDLAELGPASYAIAKSRDPGLTAFAAIAVRRGPYTPSGSHYHSLLITRQGNGFKDHTSLRGKSLGLTDPASTSGALIPRRSFTKAVGTPLETFFSRITFAGSHDRAIQAVVRRQVDAAFVSSTILDDAVRGNRVAASDIVVLWKSPPIPYDPFVYRGRLCQPLAERIKAVFLHDNDALRGMFEALQIEGFFPANDDSYREIRELYDSRP